MTKNRTLLRSQKKEVFEILREVGLEPADFAWSKEKANDKVVVSRLRYREGEYYFQFTWYEAGSRCESCPGRYQLVEYQHPTSWAEQMVQFRNWVKHLRREIECPDPWAELARYLIIIGPGDLEEMSNDTISGHGAERIAEKTSDLARAIESEFELTGEQAQTVRDKASYLAEAAKRQKSRDWAHSALGTYAALAMTLSLSEESTVKLCRLAESHLGEFVHLIDRRKEKSAI
jgi:hypothetical protein